MDNGPGVIQVEDGHDYLLDGNERLPYTLVDHLGHGHTATVAMVRDERTGSVYAQKIFRIFSSRDQRRNIFENEIKIIRRLAPHHHFVRVVATYVGKREVGLILDPVADGGDLEAFLHDFKDAESRSAEHIRVLERSFACLASGLCFMHAQQIRHKDIKPSNLLIHRGGVLYTDFGYSLDHSTALRATTTGRPQAITRRYCAPEVSNWEPRNRQSDLFSLGCVYLEILSALDSSITIPVNGTAYHAVIAKIRYTTLQLRMQTTLYALVTSIIFHMIDQKPSSRPSASTILREFVERATSFVCGRCISTLDTVPIGRCTGAVLNDQAKSAPEHRSYMHRCLLANPASKLQPDAPLGGAALATGFTPCLLDNKNIVPEDGPEPVYSTHGPGVLDLSAIDSDIISGNIGSGAEPVTLTPYHLPLPSIGKTCSRREFVGEYTSDQYMNECVPPPGLTPYAPYGYFHLPDPSSLGKLSPLNKFPNPSGFTSFPVTQFQAHKPQPQPVHPQIDITRRDSPVFSSSHFTQLQSHKPQPQPVHPQIDIAQRDPPVPFGSHFTQFQSHKPQPQLVHPQIDITGRDPPFYLSSPITPVQSHKPRQQPLPPQPHFPPSVGRPMKPSEDVASSVREISIDGSQRARKRSRTGQLLEDDWAGRCQFYGSFAEERPDLVSH